MLMRRMVPGLKLVALVALFAASVFARDFAVAQAPHPAEARVQRFGPIIVVAAHEAVPDPEKTARVLLDDSPVEKLQASQTMGVNSEPAVHELWLSMQSKEHLSELQIAGKWMSTGVPESIYEQGLKPYKVIGVGFDDLDEQHFWIESFAEEELGNWYRVATVACLCSGHRDDDLPLRPWLEKQREFSYRISIPRDSRLGWDTQLFRFRLRDGALALVFSSEYEH